MEYFIGFLAKRWCNKSQLFLHKKLGGRKYIISTEMPYQVINNNEAHHTFMSEG
ncbi:MAG: hypothetical protein H7254_10255 [Ferruginibacter sp.]|nr:hypothetical protein [Ferruginibacter sp.]